VRAGVGCEGEVRRWEGLDVFRHDARSWMHLGGSE
jgi:hypothetical protein